MNWDDGITGVHRDIAGSLASRIGVLAGPGTGKTKYGLMRRVVRLLEEGVPPNRILLISFTRVAAADLKDKVADLEAPGADKVRATTLHAFCFGLLQQAAVFATTGRRPRILLDHEVDLMLRDIGGGCGNIYSRREKLEAFVAGWARNPGDYAGIPATDEERAFQAAVKEWLRRHGAMLIGEVVPESYKYLIANPHAEALAAYAHIIVDEYQDLNALEQQLLDRLSENGNLCIAGDDDQSIYSVRHANPAGIHAFLARPDVEQHAIGTCGRCPTQILAMANSLIGCAPERNKAPLVPLEGADLGNVAIIQWSHTDAEVDGIVAAIAKDVADERSDAGRVLVLTNWAQIGKRIRDRLIEIGIPARSFFKEQWLHSDECREALALLRLVCARRDLPAMRVLLGLGDADGRSVTYRRIMKLADSLNSDVWAILDRLAAGENLGVSARALTQRFSAALERVEHLIQLNPPELVDSLFPDGSESLSELRTSALDSLGDAETASDVLHAIIEAVTQDDVPQNPNFVRIMSLHKSKGLTCDNVYIVGAVDGVIPTIRSKDATAHEAAMREGRRLFYVALTRAARKLTISSSISTNLADAAARGVMYGKKTIRLVGGRYAVTTIASPYLIELGPSAPRSQTGEAWLDSHAD